MVKEGIMLGDKISIYGIEVEKENTEGNQKFPPLVIMKDFHSLLGKVEFYH